MYGRPTENSKYLTDRFGRVHSYLRMSLTDSCNFSCTYCMPENIKCLPAQNQMSAAEIRNLAEIFYKIGIDKIRLTGGEPLIRKDFREIISALGNLPVTLGLTTNGLLLDKYLDDLKKANFTKINISLDSLKPDKFKAITKRDSFQKVFQNIFKTIDAGFEVKINAVVMKGFNDDEIEDFALLTKKYPVSMRFIEFMPFKDNNWNFGKTFRQQEIIQKLKDSFELNHLENKFNETAQLFQIAGAQGKIGIIGTVSQPFCDSCNRIRITSDGKLKSCLFGHSEYDVLRPLREGKDVLNEIKDAIQKKPHQHGGKKSFTENPNEFQENRNMTSIGG